MTSTTSSSTTEEDMEKLRASLPRGIEMSDVTLDQAIALLQDKAASPPKKKKSGKKSSTKKKTTTKS